MTEPVALPWKQPTPDVTTLSHGGAVVEIVVDESRALRRVNCQVRATVGLGPGGVPVTYVKALKCRVEQAWARRQWPPP